MALTEILILILGGAATLLGFLYKGQVKKNAVLEIEKKAHKKTAQIAIKQSNAVKLSEEEEKKHALELVEESKKEVQKDELQNPASRIANFYNFMHKKNRRK